MMAEGLDGVCVQLPSWTLAGNRHVLGIYQAAEDLFMVTTPR